MITEKKVFKPRLTALGKIMKKLEWNKKTALTSAATAMLIIVLVVVLYPREITIAENTTLDPIVWTFQRPNQTLSINNKLDATYVGDGLLLTMYILIGEYTVSVEGYDYIGLKVMINATAMKTDSYIVSVHVLFLKDEISTIDWQETRFFLENLYLHSYREGWSKEVYLKLVSVNKSKNVYISATSFWCLPTLNYQTHHMEVTYELTFFNSTHHNKISQPFQLKIIGGEGNE